MAVHLPLNDTFRALPVQLARFRHPHGTQDFSTYRCFLPDLTGFVGSCCAGPKRLHYLHRAAPQG